MNIWYVLSSVMENYHNSSTPTLDYIKMQSVHKEVKIFLNNLNISMWIEVLLPPIITENVTTYFMNFVWVWAPLEQTS